MLVHHGLHGMLAIEHAEREGAVVVGLHILALCVVDAVAVHQEVDTLHGDARAVVHDEAREAPSVSDGELAQRLVVACGVEGHGHGINVDTTLGEAYTIGDVRTALVRQFNHLEVAALIGLCGGHRIIIIGYNHVDGGCACAVVEAHVALHAAGVLTLAHRGIGLGGGAALAVVHCLYLIFVGEQRRHARVLVAHVGQARGHFLPRVLTLALHAAQHAEVVDGLVVGAPRQQHTTLARLRQQRLVYRTIVLVVEHALQLRVVDGGVLIVGLRGRGGHEFVALLRPAVAVVPSQFFLTDTCCAKGHHWQHFAVLHIPAIAQLRGQVVGRQRADVVPQVAAGHLGQGIIAFCIPSIAQFLDNIGNIVMPDAIVIDFVPAYAFVGIVIFAVAGITPCIAIPLIAESSVIHVVIISVFQAIGYVVICTACPADECSDVGCTIVFSIVLGTDGTVEQTVVDGVLCIVCMTDETAGMCGVTMNTDRYPTTLDIASKTAAHESGYMLVAAHAARDVQVLDGVVFGRKKRAVSTVEVQRIAVSIERTLEVHSRMIY